MEVSLSWALKGGGKILGKGPQAGGLRGHCSPVCVAEQPGRGGAGKRGGFGDRGVLGCLSHINSTKPGSWSLPYK